MSASRTRSGGSRDTVPDSPVVLRATPSGLEPIGSSRRFPSPPVRARSRGTPRPFMHSLFCPCVYSQARSPLRSLSSASVRGSSASVRGNKPSLSARRAGAAALAPEGMAPSTSVALAPDLATVLTAVQNALAKSLAGAGRLRAVFRCFLRSRGAIGRICRPHLPPGGVRRCCRTSWRRSHSPRACRAEYHQRRSLSFLAPWAWRFALKSCAARSPCGPSGCCSRRRGRRRQRRVLEATLERGRQRRGRRRVHWGGNYHEDDEEGLGDVDCDDDLAAKGGDAASP